MARSSQTSINGRVKRITFQNPENGYTVAKLQPDGSKGAVGGGAEIAVVGKLPGVVEGQDLSVTGRQVLHPKFGVQIEVDTFEVRQPSDDEGVQRYLASGLIKGVGPKLAQALVESLGPDAIEIILEQPQRLAEVPGIGKKRAKLISEAVRSHGELRELMVFLQGHGIAASTALRIHRRYGAGAMGVVQENPHQLAADIHGIGFATADAIAAKLGIARDHPGRLMAGLEYMLGQARDEGHVYLPYEELMEGAAELLSVDRALLGPAFARLHTEQRITLDEDGDLKAVYLTPMYILERRAGAALSRIAKGEGILTPERAAKAADWVAGQLAVAPSAGTGQGVTDAAHQRIGCAHRRTGHGQDHPGAGADHHCPPHGAFRGFGRAHRPGGQAALRIHLPARGHPAPAPGIHAQGERLSAPRIAAPGGRPGGGGRDLHG
jgi:exodeoxyribonuclease V alpha subunit